MQTESNSKAKWMLLSVGLMQETGKCYGPQISFRPPDPSHPVSTITVSKHQLGFTNTKFTVNLVLTLFFKAKCCSDNCQKILIEKTQCLKVNEYFT